MKPVPIEKRALQTVSLIGFAICVAVAVWGWQTGVLTSQEKLQDLVTQGGPAGAVLFTGFQAGRGGVPVLRGGGSFYTLVVAEDPRRGVVGGVRCVFGCMLG